MRARLAVFFRSRWQAHILHQLEQQHFTRLCLQVLFLMALLLVGLGMLHLSHTFPSPIAQRISPSSSLMDSSDIGRGNGNSATMLASPALCNPFDPSCFTNAVGASVASSILSGLQPVTTFFQNSSVNILTQTPPDDSYTNNTIGVINQGLVNAVDVALACLLLIGGYTVIIGQHVRLEQASISELLPRAVLVTCAVHFNLLFIGLFIDLNNALCNTIIAAASEQTLTNIIGGFLSINSTQTDSLVVVLIIVAAILAILLLVQMITRIALVALLITVAPLALACFVLPQTTRWGRLWFSTFSSAVLVQFLQVTALALGGMLITAIGDTAFWHLGHQLAQIFLAIGMVMITLKIPSMLQTWALHPMTTSSGMLVNETRNALSGGNDGNSSGSSDETAAKVAELLALL